MAFTFQSWFEGRDQDKELVQAFAQAFGTLSTAEQSITNLQQLIASFFPDCPDDGQLYVRRHGEWVLFEDAEEEVDD